MDRETQEKQHLDDLGSVLLEPHKTRYREHLKAECNWEFDEDSLRCTVHDIEVLPGPSKVKVDEVFSSPVRAILLLMKMERTIRDSGRERREQSRGQRSSDT